MYTTMSTRESSHTPMPSPTASASDRAGTRRRPSADGVRTRSTAATSTAANADAPEIASSPGAPGRRPNAA